MSETHYHRRERERAERLERASPVTDYLTRDQNPPEQHAPFGYRQARREGNSLLRRLFARFRSQGYLND